MKIQFKVPSVPVAQPRQRQRVIHVGGRAMASNYTPATAPVNTFKASVRHEASAAYSGSPLTGPLSVRIVSVFPRLQSQIWKSKPMPRLPKITKPDGDNLAKGILDAMNKLTFADDAQVCSLTVEKWIAAGDEQPHVEVVIETQE